MMHEFERSRSAALFFRSIGLVPLPSRMDVKRPILAEFKHFQEAGEKVPNVVYAADEWRTTNLQLMTGVKTCGATKIIVIDLDGDPGIEAWKRICERHSYKPRGIWIAKTGSGGRHLYYRAPLDLTECPSRLLWGLYDPLGGPNHEGGWVKHCAVQLLGDGVLAIAPPSRHVKTGIEYQWLGKWSPAVFALPEEAPRWLIDMEAQKLPIKPRPYSAGRSDVSRPSNRKTPDGWKGFDRNAVISSLAPAEKLRLVSDWGLRLDPRADCRRGWVDCHALGRKDETPSAGFDPVTGVYHDFGTATRLSFWDLAVALGAFPSWREALDSVGASLLGASPR